MPRTPAVQPDHAINIAMGTIDKSVFAMMIWSENLSLDWDDASTDTAVDGPSRLGVFFTGFTIPRAIPRFEVWGSAPRYGSRDEICGSINALIGVAFTRAYAEKMAARVEEDTSGEVRVTIEDRMPDPPKAWAYYPADDLPF